MSNFFAQTEACMANLLLWFKLNFKNLTGGERVFCRLKFFAGNKPTNTILIDTLAPKR
jgi:hypothetical protein